MTRSRARARLGGFGRGRIGNIASDGNALDFSRDSFGELGIEIAHRDLGALRG